MAQCRYVMAGTLPGHDVVNLTESVKWTSL